VVQDLFAGSLPNNQLCLGLQLKQGTSPRGEVAKEVQYVHALAQGMQLDSGCTPIGIDNRTALFLVEDSVSAARTKHIDVVYHYVRERVKCRQMEFEPIAAELNASDVFTNPPAVDTFAKHRSGLGLMP
jgi:hypothetical protein